MRIFIFGLLLAISYAQTASAYWAIIGSQDFLNHATGNKHPECLPKSATHSEQSNSQGNEIGVACCNESGVGERYLLKCLKAVTWDEADAKCHSKGLRLCTRDEMESGSSERKGCTFDWFLQWTSTPCAPTTDSEVSCNGDIAGETTEDEHNFTYDFIAENQDYVFDTCLTDFDTMLHILDSNGDALHFNDDHDDACESGNNQYASHLEAQLTPGEQYTLKISGYCASCYGSFAISVGCPETEVGVVRKVSISAAQRRRERAPARAARRPGLRRIEDDAESELELEEGVGTVYEVVGNVDNAITVFAMIGALTMMYYAFKGIQKMMFATGDFKKIKEDEIECYSR